MKKILIQFNEANFDLIKKYSLKYKLNAFNEILNYKTIVKTTSETEHKNLEPWIQWYSFYTSKSYKEHKIFHLGDSKNSKEKNFIDDLSEKIKVGCFASMNLPYNEKFKIYISDPWSRNQNDYSFSSRYVYKAIEQIVNSNNSYKISFSSIVGLIIMIGFPKNLNEIKTLIKSIKSFIRKDRPSLAGYFDGYFLNYSLRRILEEKLEFSMIFLNGLAHIQHRFILASQFLENNSSNKNAIDDPILKILKIYNDFFEKFLKTFNNKFDIWFITGLTQKVYNEKKIYWRFKNHNKILKNFFAFEFKIEPLMTRDFKIYCENENHLKEINKFLNESKIINNENKIISNAFSFTEFVDNKTIFSTFVLDIDNSDVLLNWKDKFISLKEDLEFVSYKNGEHSPEGWAYNNKNQKKLELPIWKLNTLIKYN
jgi:hypothetical protein